MSSQPPVGVPPPQGLKRWRGEKKLEALENPSEAIRSEEAKRRLEAGAQQRNSSLENILDATERRRDVISGVAEVLDRNQAPNAPSVRRNESHSKHAAASLMMN